MESDTITHNFMKNTSILSTFSSPLIYLVSIIGGAILAYCFPQGFLIVCAEALSDIFMNLLSLVSLPIIFFSLVTAATKSGDSGIIKLMGKKTVRYTLLTTLSASVVALIVFLLINPVHQMTHGLSDEVLVPQGSYMGYLLQALPANIVRPFLDNNVIGVLVLALLIGLSSFQLEEADRSKLHAVFSSFYALFMKMTSLIIMLIPIALFSFTVLFVRDVRGGLDFTTIGWYLACVMLSNAIQACVVLPLFLRAKGLSASRLAKAMYPALSLAFFTKSSNATVPMAVKNAVERADIDPQVARFTIPLCTSINMNACAAFILTTTLFVSMSYGVILSPIELVLWVFVATIAAVGNAGVPMGCYFLSSAFLAAMGVPLQMMGIILPFYAIIDAFETSINVWSDASCALIVDSELKKEGFITPSQVSSSASS